MSFFFVLFSAGFPKIISIEGQVIIEWFMAWWSELNPVVRAAFVPHFLVGHIMMVTTIISLFRYERTGMVCWGPIGAFAGFIAAIVHPPSMIQSLLILPFYTILNRKKYVVMGSLTICISGVLGLSLINHAASVFPWNLPMQYEGISFFVPISEYLLGLGPVVFLACAGSFVRRKKQETWLLIIWIVTSVIMIPIAKMMPYSPITIIREHPVSNIRFLQVAIWVPLGILGAYGLDDAWHRFGKIIGMIIVIILLILTFIGYPASIHKQAQETYGSWELSYPEKGNIEAFRQLDQIVPSDHSVFSL